MVLWNHRVVSKYNSHELPFVLPKPYKAHEHCRCSCREAFPEAVWLSGARLHQAQRRVAHRWVPVAPGDWETALVVSHRLRISAMHGMSARPY